MPHPPPSFFARIRRNLTIGEKREPLKTEEGYDRIPISEGSCETSNTLISDTDYF